MPDPVVNPAGEVPPAAVITDPAAALGTPAVPAVVPAPVAAPVVAAKPAGETPPAGDPPDPNWLNSRIAKAKNSATAETTAKLLKDLGVDTIEAAKAKIDAAKKVEDEKLSTQERLDKRIKELEPEALRATKLSAIVTQTANRELAALTEEQQVAVKARAGDDPSAQLDTIEWLRGNGFLKPAAAPAVAEVAAPAGKLAVPAPASTTAAGGAPVPANAGQVDHKAVYADLQKHSPIDAAYYAEKFGQQIFQ